MHAQGCMAVEDQEQRSGSFWGTPLFLPQPWCSIKLNNGELRLSHVAVKASIETDCELIISRLAVREINFQ